MVVDEEGEVVWMPSHQLSRKHSHITIMQSLSGGALVLRGRCRCVDGGRLGRKVHVAAPIRSRAVIRGRRVGGSIRSRAAASATTRTVASFSLKFPFTRKKKKEKAADPEVVADPAPSPPSSLSSNAAVIVAGATGKLGTAIVRKILEEGTAVKALVKDATNADDLAGMDGVDLIAGFDITDRDTYERIPWIDAQALVMAVGGGGEGYDPSRVDASGVRDLAEFAVDKLGTEPTRASREPLLAFGPDAEQWTRLDDVIMGGRSCSRPVMRGTSLCWSGELVYEDGGFCGMRSPQVGAGDRAARFDGITFKILGDGQRYKFSVRCRSNETKEESSYQANVDTADGEWKRVWLRWDDFVAVDQAIVMDNAPPLDPSNILTFGLVLSRFSYNGLRNTNCREGPFLVEIEKGIEGFTEARPKIILISSAAVERYQRIQADSAKVEADIPIVQLNPKRILNAKYYGEQGVRACAGVRGVGYAILRPVGLKDEIEGPEGVIEVAQGDAIVGTITREDVAEVVCLALSSPFATNATFEIARRPYAGTSANVDRQAFLKQGMMRLVADHRRQERGIDCFPKQSDGDVVKAC